MTFVSYAQNFEDVMLYRALKGIENGFYIDIGANDPTLYSVTRAFYEKGWKGINIEPVAFYFDKLKEERKRDINLQIAISDLTCTTMFFDIPNSGLATIIPEIAEKHRKEGWDIDQFEVKVLTMSDVWDQYVEGDVHFVKIDVEGAEAKVVNGMDLGRCRPWILVIESTKPLSNESSHENWDAKIIESEYQFVYFDGLNRFYIAKEHSDLSQHFSTPPNVFDGFVLNVDQESRLRADEADARAYRFQQRIKEIESELTRTVSLLADIESKLFSNEKELASARQELMTLHKNAQSIESERMHLIERVHQLLKDLDTRNKDTQRLEIEIKKLSQSLEAVYQSSSWRITAPLRTVKSILRS